MSDKPSVVYHRRIQLRPCTPTDRKGKVIPLIRMETTPKEFTINYGHSCFDRISVAEDRLYDVELRIQVVPKGGDE